MQMQNSAIYLRLSRDDGVGSESDSIKSQRMFLNDYCRKNGFTITAEYCDDGYSGTSYERPDFKRMLRDALDGKFSVIITKDMSRLGRDYIATGEYIERIFPENGIRYIAVNDGVDTKYDCSGNDMVPFKAVFNDMYAKDISRKVRTALDSKRKAGRFIGSTAPYGYKKDENDNAKLVPDSETSPVVELIYKEFLKGKSMLSIAKKLTQMGVSTPSSRKNGKIKSKSWNSVMIKRILTNPTYKGDITQGFDRKLNYKSQKRNVLPECERIVVKSTHKAIVSGEMFLAVQNVLKKE